ncbi:MAG: zinc-ribbon domain-containing protein [Clostridia bacterium]|nr:zinc-ribbon domain-containing protein [Clostridia bacterium]
MAKFCAECGSPIEEGAKFCLNCGAATGVKETAKKKKPAKTEKTAKTEEPVKAEEPAKTEEPVKAEKPAKAKNSKKIIIPIVAAVLALTIAVTGFAWPGWLKSGKNKRPSPKKNEKPCSDMTVGDLGKDGFSLFVEEGTFGEFAQLSADPIDVSDKVKDLEIIGTPVDLSCDEYDGLFFGTTVKLTVALPEGEKDPSDYVFVTIDEKTGETRYLYPDNFDSESGTMELLVPHFSPWFSAKLTDKQKIDNFLDSYCTKQAVENGQKKQAASELEPYVRAKAEALGLNKKATEDLVQSTVNYLGGQTTGDYKDATETGTKAITAIVRGIYDDDKEAAQSGLEDAVNGAISHCWDDLKFSERIDKVLDSKVAGTAAGKAVGNAKGIGAMAGYIAEGDTKGAMEELGNILQNIHPAAELATKSTAYIASSANIAFTEWKSNQIEELYKIYRDGFAEDVWGNEVVAQNRQSFLNYLNCSSGFTVAKGVNRFYNLDKIGEVCERYGWNFKSYKEMPQKYRDEFQRRAEDSLMQYFELRVKQEKEAEKLKEQERVNIETMLSSYGALTAGNYMDFFHEESADDYNITNRLERLINVRNFLTQYVDQKALNQSMKDGSFNWGDIINWWVSYADKNPKDAAIDMLIKDLEEYELLNPDFKIDPLQEKMKLFEGIWNIQVSSAKVGAFRLGFTITGTATMKDNATERTWTCKYDEKTDTFTLTTNYVMLDKGGKWVPEDKTYTMVITNLDKASFSGTDNDGTISGTR